MNPVVKSLLIIAAVLALSISGYVIVTKQMVQTYQLHPGEKPQTLWDVIYKDFSNTK